MIKNPPANAGDAGSMPRSVRFPGVGNGNPLQYSCLENSMDRGAWWATVHGVAKSWTMTEQLSKHEAKGKESEKIYMYVYVCVCVQRNHFSVHLKFTQPCKYYTLILLLIILKVHVSFHSYRSQGNISVWVP